MTYELLTAIIAATLLTVGASGIVWSRRLMAEGKRRRLAARAQR